jgi:hypothetical protein
MRQHANQATQDVQGLTQKLSNLTAEQQRKLKGVSSRELLSEAKGIILIWNMLEEQFPYLASGKRPDFSIESIDSFADRVLSVFEQANKEVETRLDTARQDIEAVEYLLSRADSVPRNGPCIASCDHTHSARHCLFAGGGTGRQG